METSYSRSEVPVSVGHTIIKCSSRSKESSSTFTDTSSRGSPPSSVTCFHSQSLLILLKKGLLMKHLLFSSKWALNLFNNFSPSSTNGECLHFPLSIWYYWFPLCPNDSLYEITYSYNEDHWVGILDLAHKWQFDLIHKLAVKMLGCMSIDAVPKILLCQRYGIELDWAMDAFILLCTRESPLSADEGEKMGATMAVLIAQVREILREKSTVAVVDVDLYLFYSKEREVKAATIVIQKIIISRQYVLMHRRVIIFNNLMIQSLFCISKSTKNFSYLSHACTRLHRVVKARKVRK